MIQHNVNICVILGRGLNKQRTILLILKVDSCAKQENDICVREWDKDRYRSSDNDRNEYYMFFY